MSCRNVSWVILGEIESMEQTKCRSGTARHSWPTAQSLLGGEVRNRPVPMGFSRQNYPIGRATQALLDVT